MSDFVVIETQEQLDAVLKERLDRSEKKWAEKYANYLSPDDVKSKVEDLNKQIADLGNSLKEANEKATADGTAIADLEAKIKSYETASVKSRIATEVGLPYELANRLSGETEEEWKADAEALMKLVGQHGTPMPRVNPEMGENVDKSDASLKEMLRNMNLND